MNKYKLLLFDLDGTLCDTDEMIVQTMHAIYKEYKPVKERTREEQEKNYIIFLVLQLEKLLKTNSLIKIQI